MKEFKKFEETLQRPVIKEIISKGANVFFVGGCVRDAIMSNIEERKIDSKDIDIIVQKMHFNDLLELLKRFGQADLVGQSFGVIKYKEDDFELDIALPRRDRISEDHLTNENAHTAIIAQSDPFMSIESDLERRDFTINSIAVSQNLEIIDPFNGIEDIKNKMIKATNINTFVDDPLRIMRAIRFSLRFNFMPDKETYEEIQRHVSSLKKITAERKGTEIESIIKDHVKKQHEERFGVQKDFGTKLRILFLSGGSGKEANEFLEKVAAFFRYLDLYEPVLGFQPTSYLSSMKDKINSVAEFLVCFRHEDKDFDYAKHYKKQLKIDNDTEKSIKALNFFMIGMFELSDKPATLESVVKARWLYFNAMKLFPALKSEFFYKLEKDFKIEKLPTSRGELAIDGNDLLALGFKGSEIAEAMNAILDEIFHLRVKNVKADILAFIPIYKANNLVY